MTRYIEEYYSTGIKEDLMTTPIGVVIFSPSPPERADKPQFILSRHVRLCNRPPAMIFPTIRVNVHKYYSIICLPPYPQARGHCLRGRPQTKKKIKTNKEK